mmetsp:Transcript_42697/g.68640  ORF Transcript_42697/g.68640 Transcript_42697/m.68640 type:complete len:200 (+) Transcript_42697:152-751(+)
MILLLCRRSFIESIPPDVSAQFANQSGVRVVENLNADMVVPSSQCGIFVVNADLKIDTFKTGAHRKPALYIFVGEEGSEEMVYKIPISAQMLVLQSYQELFECTLKLAQGLTNTKFEAARSWMETTSAKLDADMEIAVRSIVSDYLPLHRSEAHALLDVFETLENLATLDEASVKQLSPLSQDDIDRLIDFLQHNETVT